MRQSNNSAHLTPRSKRPPRPKEPQKPAPPSVQHVTSIIKWIPFLLVFHLFVLTFDHFSSKQQALVEKGIDMDTDKYLQVKTPLGRRAKFYLVINLLISFFSLIIAGIAFFGMLPKATSDSERRGLNTIITLSLCLFIIFLTRLLWMSLIGRHGCQVTNSPDDYVLERTTFLAWALLIVIGRFEIKWQMNTADLGLEPVVGWIIVLVLWTPIVSIVGPSWGKLKAINPNGQKVIWPFPWWIKSKKSDSQHP